MDSRFDSTDFAIPAQVRLLACGRPVRVVWRNGVGGVTCEYGEGEGRLAARPPKVNLNLGKDDWPKGDQ